MNRKAALAAASMEAQRLHALLNTDYNRPIDVFRIVQEMGIWLVSRPLGSGLFGFYLREGDAAGIVLNASHPEYLQRYTCAHELGHHVLGHRSHLDERDDVMGDAPADRHDEHAAQMFAGNLLMPIQAVNRVQRRLGISRDRSPTADEVYALSRELDVSFQAAAWQLVSLGRLSTASAARMVRAGSAETKRTMRPGPHPLGDNRAGLVIIDEGVRDVPVLLRPGDEVRIRVSENAATGYLWKLDSSEGTRVDSVSLSWDGANAASIGAQAQPQAASAEDLPVVLMGDGYMAPGGSDEALGVSEGQREFVFVADHPGRQELVFALRRPWEEGAPRDRRATTVRVGPKRVLDGIAEGQLRGHVARVGAGGGR